MKAHSSQTLVNNSGGHFRNPDSVSTTFLEALYNRDRTRKFPTKISTQRLYFGHDTCIIHEVILKLILLDNIGKHFGKFCF